MAERRAEARWEGDLAHGRGTFTVDSGVLRNNVEIRVDAQLETG